MTKKFIDYLTIDNTLRVLVFPFKNILHVVFSDYIAKTEVLRRLLAATIFFQTWCIMDYHDPAFFWGSLNNNYMASVLLAYNVCHTIMTWFAQFF